MSIQIEKPGMLTTVQDEGRQGYARYGISTNGAMDGLAHTLANWLVGNDAAEATLEVTWSGLSAHVLENSWIAVTGGNLEPWLDDQPLPMWRPVYVQKGSRISFRKVITGCRAYIAIAGGWQMESVLGSYSTYLRAGIGGWAGRALQQGDVLYSRFEHAINAAELEQISEKATDSALEPIDAIVEDWTDAPSDQSNIAANTGKEDRTNATSSLPASSRNTFENSVVASETTTLPSPVRWRVSSHILPHYSDEVTIRIVAGRQWEDFEQSSQQLFLEQAYRVTPQSDRMGYRLAGEPLQLKQSTSYLSEAVTHGTIQVPVDGQPIILMADRQTLGGYAKIAHVIRMDLPLLAQLAPGATVRFRRIELDEAQRIYVEWTHELKLLRRMIQLRLSALGLRVQKNG